MRVIWPSAKMQTTSPFWMASLAVRSDWSISRGRSSEEMGMARRMRAKGFTQRLLVDALEHDEAHMPVGGGQQQQRVHEREVVADEQRAAFAGDVFAAIHPDAIDGMREHPQHEPQQGIRQQPDHINRRRQRHQRADREDAARAEVQPHGQHPVNARGHEQARRGQQVGRGQHHPFLFLAGPMLEDRGDGDDEEAAEEAQRGHRAQDLAEAQRRLPEERREDR